MTVLFVLVLLVGFSYIYYDSELLESRELYLKSLYEGLSSEEKFIPNEIKDVVVLTSLDDGENLNGIPDSVLQYVSETASIKFEEPSRLLIWKLKNYLMRMALIEGLNDSEILALYCYFIPYEKGYGILNSAKYHYRKNLNELTLDEIIGLLVIARSPSGYSPESEPDRYQNMKKVLMTKYSINKEIVKKDQ